jgi:hypothetical protein
MWFGLVSPGMIAFKREVDQEVGLGIQYMCIGNWLWSWSPIKRFLISFDDISDGEIL